MDYSDSATNIIVPGVILPLPAGLSLNERLYLVADNDGFSFLTNRLTLEYRPDPSYSCGTELGHEHRAGQYDKAGATLFCRYWW